MTIATELDKALAQAKQEGLSPHSLKWVFGDGAGRALAAANLGMMVDIPPACRGMPPSYHGIEITYDWQMPGCSWALTER